MLGILPQFDVLGNIVDGMLAGRVTCVMIVLTVGEACW